MDVVHQGFDNLDLSFCAQLSPELQARLEAAQNASASEYGETIIELNGQDVIIENGGMAGGYAFRLDTGPLGGTWAFKRRNAREPWGAKFSSKSLPLAVRGIEVVFSEAVSFLKGLGMQFTEAGLRVSRADYCIDILAPEFVLNPDQFIAPSRTSGSERRELSSARAGARVTSTTLGKMPSSQVIAYDKRAEVLTRRKFHWFKIWNSNQETNARPQIDFENVEASRVWRIEARLGREALDRAGAKSWSGFCSKAGELFVKLLRDFRYCLPNGDSNRSRWPIHPIWHCAQEAIADGLLEMPAPCSEGLILGAQQSEYRRMAEAQLASAAIRIAALDGVGERDFRAHLDAMLRRAVERIDEHPIPLEERLEAVQRRIQMKFPTTI